MVKQKSKDEVVKTLGSGGYVISIQNKGYWTNDGQYVLIYGYDGTYFFVDDPMSRKYYQKADDFMTTSEKMAHITRKE